MNRACRQIFALAVMAALGFVAYLALLASPLAREMTILFYRGTVLALAAATITAVVAGLIGRRFEIDLLAIPAFAVTLSGCVCFLVLFPVTIDRSISVYLLATIEAQGGDAADLERAFVEGYVKADKAIDRRIGEQITSGNVALAKDGTLRLTPQGARFLDVSRAGARLLGISPRFVEGFHSDPSVTRAQGK